jgi:hypothetical protein
VPSTSGWIVRPSRTIAPIVMSDERRERITETICHLATESAGRQRRVPAHRFHQVAGGRRLDGGGTARPVVDLPRFANERKVSWASTSGNETQSTARTCPSHGRRRRASVVA